MRLVVFSDLHLDAPFAWLASDPQLARQRRLGLRDTLSAIVDLVREINADALLCGGDLFEHDRITPDTAAFIVNEFARLGGVRVFLAPGNHDWYGPQSVYAQADWSPNVKVFTRPELEPVELTEDVTLWGAAHCVPANTPGLLRRLSADRSRVNLALFHGSERSRPQAGKELHAPFAAAEIKAAGLDHAFVGHYHVPVDGLDYTYPGNPDPLEFGEDGDRGAVLFTAGPEGIKREGRRRVAQTTVCDVSVNVSSCTNQQEIRKQIQESIIGSDGFVRVTVSGELAPDIDFNPQDLRRDLRPGVVLRTSGLRTGYNLDEIEKEPSVRGQFVHDVRSDPTLNDEERQRILVTGLRALDGRQDLEAWP